MRVLKLDGYCFIDIPDPIKKYAQERDWIFKYDLGKFETVVESAGLKIIASNNAGYMLQYLFSKI